jgi:hypothetical protein
MVTLKILELTTTHSRLGNVMLISGLRILQYIRAVPITIGVMEWQKKLLELAARCCKRVMRIVSTFRDLLQAYRNTPLLGSIDTSPAQILFICRIRTDLPTTSKALEPIIQANVHDALCIKQAKVKLNHDKTARRKEIDFKKGKNVVIRTE